MLTILALAGVANAVPFELTHQGRLLDPTGVPLTGINDVTFTLYDSPTAGAVIWTENQTLSLDEGYYSAVLGNEGTNPLDDSDLDGAPAWLGISVNSGAELPRIAVRSVPYAYRANTSANVVGGIVDVSEIRVDGSTVIDGSGSFVGSGGGTLSSLVCTAGQSAVFDGTDWGCGDLASTPSWDDITDKPFDFADDTDDDALGTIGACTDGQTVKYDATSSAWTCGDDIDTNDDTLGAVTGCADGQTVKWDTTAGGWACADDIDTDTDTDTQLDDAAVDGFVTNAVIDLFAGSMVGGALLNDWGALTSVPGGFADGVDDDLLGGMTCADGEIPKYDGTSGAWGCADDDVLDAATVVGMVEAAGDVNLTGVVGLGTTTDACTAANEGSIRYEAGVFEGCDGTAWTSLSGPSGPFVWTGVVNNTMGPTVPMGAIPGTVGRRIHILEIGICGDSDASSGDNRFVADDGLSLNFTWAAGKNNVASDHRVGPTQNQGPGGPRSLETLAVDYTAAVGQPVDISWDFHSDWDGLYCQDTDALGNVYDDSSMPSSVRAWVRYELL